MSRRPQSTHWDTREGARVHKEKLMRKVQKIETLRALVEMHEAAESPDFEYLRELKARMRSAENQLRCMAGDNENLKSCPPTNYKAARTRFQPRT